MLTPTTKSSGVGVRAIRSVIASTPSFFSPLFTTIDCERISRLRRGGGFPGVGSAVTDPTSTPPNPMRGRTRRRRPS
jgi:hypothetical protein